jgi:PAS domain S-box-containing protein
MVTGPGWREYKLISRNEAWVNNSPLPQNDLAQQPAQPDQLQSLQQKLAAAEALNCHLSATLSALDARLNLANSAIDNLPGMLAYWDAQLHCRFANMQYLQWFGRTHDDMIGISMQDLLGPQLFAKNEAYIRAVLRGEDQSFERTLTKDNGETGYTWARYLAHRINGNIDGFFAIVLDISEIKRAQLLQARLADIVGSANDAIISKNPEGLIDSWNPAAERMFGYRKQRIINQPETLLITRERQLEDTAILERVKAGEYIEQWETRRTRLDGHILDVSINYSPIHNSEGQLMGISEVIRDISEKKQFDRMKNEFVSTVSHELRTPLTSIRGALGLIAGGVAGPLSQQCSSLIRIATNNCDRLGQLVNDILDVEKLAAGKFDFHLEHMDMRELVAQTVANDQAYARQLEVRLVLEVDANPCPVQADSNRIMQVLSNLFSNAIKFSNAGQQVDVTVSQHQGQVRVDVRDHGCGIDEQFRQRIFQKFAQADASDTRKVRHCGTGLGLSISKAIIEQHGGQIGYSSEVGRGSCFYFTLPMV